MLATATANGRASQTSQPIPSCGGSTSSCTPTPGCVTAAIIISVATAVTRNPPRNSQASASPDEASMAMPCLRASCIIAPFSAGGLTGEARDRVGGRTLNAPIVGATSP